MVSAVMPPVSRIEFNDYNTQRNRRDCNGIVQAYPFSELPRRKQVLSAFHSLFKTLKPVLEAQHVSVEELNGLTPSSLYSPAFVTEQVEQQFSSDAQSLLHSSETLLSMSDDSLLLASLDGWSQLLRHSFQLVVVTSLLYNDLRMLESFDTTLRLPPIPSIQEWVTTHPQDARCASASNREALLHALESAYLFVLNASEEELKNNPHLRLLCRNVQSCCLSFEEKKEEVKVNPIDDDVLQEACEEVKTERQEEGDVMYISQGVVPEKRKERERESRVEGDRVRHSELREELKLFYSTKEKRKTVVVGDAFQEECEEEKPPTPISHSPVSFFSLLSKPSNEPYLEWKCFLEQTEQDTSRIQLTTTKCRRGSN